MSLTLDDWQEEVLAYEGDIILCTGRQVGKTTIMAIKAAKRMIDKPKTKVLIVSLTEDQAKLIIVMILSYLERECKKDIAKGKDKPTQNKVTLKNGSVALARPVGNTGDAIRGFTGDVLIIDEASRMPELAFTSGEPTLLTTGGEIWMCSTPHGKTGYFYQCFLNEDKMWKVFHISSEKVIYERPISSGWSEEKRAKSIQRLEKYKKTWTALRYGQEFLGLFMDDLRQFFDDELINKVCTEKRRESFGLKFLGVDIGRLGGDESTFEIICKEDGKYYQTESVVTTRQLTTSTEQKIVEMDLTHNFRQIGIDAGAGSLGVGIYDHLLQTSIKRKLKAMNNRALVLDKDGKSKQRMQKEDFYDNFKAMLERGELKLLDDEKVRLSLKSVQFEIAHEEEGGSKVRIFGNYTHIVEGLIRAAWLAKQDKGLNFSIDYIPHAGSRPKLF